MADERMADGVEHLQAAALEVIQAARAFLDVAEGVIGDRDRIGDAVASVAAIADAAARAGRSAAASSGERTRAGAEADPDVPWWASARPEADGGLQRIDVS